MDNEKFADKAHEAFEKWVADNMEWIDSLGLDAFDELLFKANLKNCFVDGMKYGVNVIKDGIT